MGSLAGIAVSEQQPSALACAQFVQQDPHFPRLNVSGSPSVCPDHHRGCARRAYGPHDPCGVRILAISSSRVGNYLLGFRGSETIAAYDPD